jgi:acetylglutamate kinase
VKLLIKIGGTLIDSDERRQALAPQIARQFEAGHRISVVHGGGKQLSRYLEEHGIQSEFRGGFRVTPPEIIEAVLRIFAGSVNHHLVAALQQAGLRSVGLTGIDAGLVRARQLSADLGAVGQVEEVDAALLDLLTAEGYIPTVACIAGGRDGAIFNVNADQMAVACGSQWQADKLIFLTDVEGVLDAGRQRLPHLTAAGALGLIETGVAQGGMEAKLRAAMDGVTRGIGEVRIVAGSQPDILDRLMRNEDVGTTLVAS